MGIMRRIVDLNIYDFDGNYIGKYDSECIPLELRAAN